MDDFLYFIFTPLVLALAAAFLYERPKWQLAVTSFLGLAIALLANLDGLRVPIDEGIDPGGLLLIFGPTVVLVTFVLLTHLAKPVDISKAASVGIVLIGAPVSYFVGFGLCVQIGMLLGWLRP